MHDASRKTLSVRDGVPEEVICSLCGRLPALTILDLWGVKSLTTEGLRAVGGLTPLTRLNLTRSNVTNAGLRELRGLTALSTLYLSRSNVTDVGLRELRGLTALSTLYLDYCPSVTDVGLQELTTLTALTQLYVYGCSTSKAGRDALKAAIPGLTIYGGR
jgi:internalin A